MTANEVTAARTELGVTPAECAEHLGVSSADVAAWEAGDTRIPRPAARMLSWLVMMKQRERAFNAAGLPECSWRNQEAARQEVVTDGEVEKWDAHVASCAKCQTIEAYITTHLGPEPPMPGSGSVAILAAIGRFVFALPAWARPALAGAAMLFAMVALDLVLDLLSWLMGGSSPPLGWGHSVRGLVIFTFAGGALGLVYGGCAALYRRLYPRDV